MKKDIDTDVQNNNKYILLAVPVYFPYGQAYSGRLMNFARIFSEEGYKVHVIAGYTYDKKNVLQNSYEINGFTYEIMGVNNHFYHYFQEKRTYLSRVESFIKKNDTFALFYVGSYNNRVVKLCRKYGVKTILERCEIYDYTSYKLGRLDYRYYRTRHTMKTGYPKNDYFIAISTYIQRFFKSQGNESVVIPTILDINNTTFTTETSNKKIELMFAGSIGGHKELFYELFCALNKFGTAESNPFHLSVFGGSREAVLREINNDGTLLDSLKGVVDIKGRVSQELINGIYTRADYSVFFRPDRESSNAGFPTKLGESMAAGTPVISNLTGDIGCYLFNGYNGFVADKVERESICSLLSQILELSREQYTALRLNSRKTAQEYFDYKVYVSRIKEFIGD